MFFLGETERLLNRQFVNVFLILRLIEGKASRFAPFSFLLGARNRAKHLYWSRM